MYHDRVTAAEVQELYQQHDIRIGQNEAESIARKANRYTDMSGPTPYGYVLLQVEHEVETLH